MLKSLLAAAAAIMLSSVAVPAMAQQCTGDNMLTENPDGTVTCGPDQPTNVAWTVEDPQDILIEVTRQGQVRILDNDHWPRAGQGKGGNGIYEPEHLRYVSTQRSYWNAARWSGYVSEAGFGILSIFGPTVFVRAAAAGGVGAGFASDAIIGGTSGYYNSEWEKECGDYVKSTRTITDNHLCD